MSSSPRLSANTRRFVARAALLAFAATLPTVACTTSDKVLAWEDTSDDAGSSVLPEGGQAADAGATCGNGVREEGEACDDGNTKSGDGCSATCAVEAPAPNQCPGKSLPLTAPDPDKRVGSVTGSTDASPLSADSPTCGGGNGKDVVYAVTSDVQGRARVRLDASFDALLYVRTA